MVYLNFWHRFSTLRKKCYNDADPSFWHFRHFLYLRQKFTLKFYVAGFLIDLNWAIEIWTTCKPAFSAELSESEQPVIYFLCWAIEIWTTCHLTSLLSYWNLNNLSLTSCAELLKSEQPATWVSAELLKPEQHVTCFLCWVIEIWTTCHLLLVLSYWNLNNLSLGPLLSYWNLNNLSLASCAMLLKSEQPVTWSSAELLKPEQYLTCFLCWAFEIWTTCHLNNEYS